MTPFAIEPPALISVSGGRTSHFMLRQILDAHGGTLPSEVFVAFCNTGKERPETLAFVHECEQRWKVKIYWLEYRRPSHDEVTGLLRLDVVREAIAATAALGGTEKQQAKRRRAAIRDAIRAPQARLNFRECSFYTASRNGEPFRQLIAVRNFLPNPVTRFCTQELKIRTARNFMWSRGYREWNAVLGIRADEPLRIAKMRASKDAYGCGGTVVMPLVEAGVDKAQITAWWKTQPFDLQLRSWEGNCDLCFLKAWKKRVRIVRDRPELVRWWAEVEAEAEAQPRHPRCSRFRIDTPSYAELLSIVESQPLLFDDAQLDPGCVDEDPLMACVGCLE